MVFHSDFGNRGSSHRTFPKFRFGTMRDPTQSRRDPCHHRSLVLLRSSSVLHRLPAPSSHLTRPDVAYDWEEYSVWTKLSRSDFNLRLTILPATFLVCKAPSWGCWEYTQGFSSTPVMSHGILPKERQGFEVGLQLQPGRAEWILKRNCLRRLNGSSMKTFPSLSASAVRDMRPC